MVIEQSGIKSVTLYENKELSFYFHDSVNLDRISALTTTGETISVLNENEPKLEINIPVGLNRKLLFDYSLDFRLFGLTLENFDTYETLKNSVYGWKVLIAFYDGSYKFFNTPLWFTDDKEGEVNESMHFNFNLKNRVPTPERFYNYYTVSALGVRADTTLVTADSTLITADYTL